MTFLTTSVFRRWLAVLLCGALGLAAGGCCHRAALHTDPRTPEEAKLEASLRRQLRAAPDAPVAVLIGLDDAPDDAARLLEEAGLRLRTVADAVVVAEGLPDAIRRAARYPFVRSIALSEHRNPNPSDPPRR